ncbi:MAG TPA: hypothetical protein VNA86_12165 [bacterium]|nr:hypothetical protein [bacterium]
MLLGTAIGINERVTGKPVASPAKPRRVAARLSRLVRGGHS